jgi:hypothetical protein
MAWQGIEGHDVIVRRFAAAAERGRVGGSYLFVGQPGVGKGTFARRLAKRVASAPSSPAVVSIDHVPKSSEQRGRYALGSQHKIAGLTGGAYVFEVRRRLSRATVEPVTAVVEVKVSKDRPGHVRALGLEAGVRGSDGRVRDPGHVQVPSRRENLPNRA